MVATMIFCFDLDDTLCISPTMDYSKAEPIITRITRVNELYATGHRIKIYTARGSETGIDWKNTTESQLANWGLMYHELYFGKPSADIYVDDKACNERDFEW
jgi:hypothetical protein